MAEVLALGQKLVSRKGNQQLGLTVTNSTRKGDANVSKLS